MSNRVRTKPFTDSQFQFLSGLGSDINSVRSDNGSPWPVTICSLI